MSAAKKGSERKVRSSAGMTEKERADWGNMLEEVIDELKGRPDTLRKHVEVVSILHDIPLGRSAVQASVELLKRDHEAGLADAILMPMAMGIMMGIHIGTKAHERTTRRKP